MISFVVPIFNEEESVQIFYETLTMEVKKLEQSYEIIFIDDGSTDATLSLLKKIVMEDKHVHVFSFRKNQGKSEALTVGFQKAKGKYIITLDADLQDRPSEVHKLLEKINGEWDVVCGWRKNRKHKKTIVVASKIFNFLARSFWGLHLHDYNCGLKVYTQEAAKSLRLYGGLHRFIPLLAYEQGFAVTEVEVQHDKRQYGKPKYGISKVWREMPDILTMLFLNKYSKRPMHFFGTLGSSMFFVGFLLAVYLTVQHFAGIPIWRRPLLTLGMLLMLGGLQIFLTGFLADLIINTSTREIVHYPLRYSSENE